MSYRAPGVAGALVLSNSEGTTSLSRRAKATVICLVLLVGVAAGAFGGQVVSAMRGQRFDLVDAKGTVRASLRLDAQGMPVLMTCDQNGVPEGSVLLATLLNPPPMAPPTPKTGAVHGVVTYFFNDNYGAKPDVGAKVWLLKGTQDLPSNDTPIWGEHGRLNIGVATGRVAPIGGFRTYADQIALLDAQIEAEKAVVAGTPRPTSSTIECLGECSADGNGNVALDGVPPGDYTIAILSAHRSAWSMRDHPNAWAWKHVVVEAGRTADASCDF